MATIQPPKYITVTMVRHAQSLANVYKNINHKAATDKNYKNSKLSDLGKHQIDIARSEIIKNIGKYDLILTSPLKRAIQTCQLVLQNDQINNRYPCAIMAELGTDIENKFHNRNDTKNDTDINTLPNYDKIVWTDHIKYDLLWKNNYINNDPRKDPNFFRNYQLRINLLKTFLANLKNVNAGDNILIFTHWVIINRLTQKNCDNLSIVKFRFNCTDETIDQINYIPIQIPQNIESKVNTNTNTNTDTNTNTNINITFIANADSSTNNPLKLSDLGKYQIEQSRDEILKNIGDISKYVILSSPLKNALQTAQLVLKDKIVTINPCAIVSDFNSFYPLGNKVLKSREVLKQDPNILEIKTPIIDWLNSELYDSGWKTEYKNSNPKNDPIFYNDIAKRLYFFYIYLCKNFKNKHVLIFGHPSFISHITNNKFKCDELNIFKFKYICDQIKCERIIKINIPKLLLNQVTPEQKSEEINVLSYNICYQCMLNKQEGSVHFICNQTCATNIIRFINTEINNKDYHFIGLQESSGYINIIQQTPKLQSMKHELYTPGQEDMILFYNKYTLDENYMVKSWMSDNGRPFMILFFNNDICVINIHAGHSDDIYKFDEHLNNTFLHKKHKSEVKGNEAEIRKRLATYKIICMGDLNHDIPNGIKIYNRPLYGRTTKVSCCDSSQLFTKGASAFSPYDHILTSWNDPNITKVHNPSAPASDHLPVSRTVNLPVLQTGGVDNMYEKYIKYKYKYMQLKNNYKINI